MVKKSTPYLFLLMFILVAIRYSADAMTFSIILGRPTDKAITANILFDENVEFYIEYGKSNSVYEAAIPVKRNTANAPDEVEINNLQADTKYYYRLLYRKSGIGDYTQSPQYSFHTQRAKGADFTFVIEADEHLYDKKGVRSLYKVTLQNQAKDSADFLISLGDTFGDDHTPDETTSKDMDELHRDYLQYLGAVCHSMPFYFCLGNHEGENGYYLKQNAPNNIAVYGTLWRKYYYPNPFPNDFYSGNMTKEGFGMDAPENYYAWTWGDALFVVLDVYRHCDINEKPKNWEWTLGDDQYKWLKKTLEESSSKYKFVFAHHTRGQGRGGVKTATGYEWGGYEANKNVWEFDKYRPGWELPIHQLMVKHGVSIYFQGHDHLYAKEELNGIVYQEVPMACDSTYEIGVLANADAYTGVILDGSGHLRVNVSSENVTVDYIRAYLPADTLGGKHRNGEVAHSYTVKQNTSVNSEEIIGTNDINIQYVRNNEIIMVQANTLISNQNPCQLLSLCGEIVNTTILNEETHNCTFDVAGIPSGTYFIKWYDSQHRAHIGKCAIIR